MHKSALFLSNKTDFGTIVQVCTVVREVGRGVEAKAMRMEEWKERK